MGGSHGEVREGPIARTHYPDGTFTNPKQQGVDLTQGHRVTEVKEVFTKTRDGGFWTVVETREGGAWVQIKSLQPIKFNADGTPDLAEAAGRISDAIDISVFKADRQVSHPEAKAWWSTDNDKYKVNLKDPDALEVFVEMPGMERLTPAQQTALREGAAEALAKHTAGWEFKVPSSVRLEPQAPDGLAGTPVAPPPDIAAQGGKAAATLGEAEQVAAAAKARELISRGAAGERSLVSAGDAAFVVFTIAGAVYVYCKAPDGQKIVALRDFGLETLFSLAVASAIGRLVSSAAAIGAGLFLPLASDNGTDPDREDKLRQLTQRLFPEAKTEEAFEARLKQVRKIQGAKPIDLTPAPPSDAPEPIERKLEVRPKVPSLGATVATHLYPAGAKAFAHASGEISGQRLGQIRTGEVSQRMGLSGAARALGAEQMNANRSAGGGASGHGGASWLGGLFSPSSAGAADAQRAGLQASEMSRNAAQQAAQQAQQAAQQASQGGWRAPFIAIVPPTPAPSPFVAPQPVQPPQFGNGGIGPPSFVPPPTWIPQTPPPPPTVTFSSTSYQIPCNPPIPPTIRI
jgi:hypothetical protein